MLRKNFQRAAVAIVLMVTLLAPLGICRQPAPAAKHRCCAMASDHDPSVRTDCCVVRTPVAAIASERVLPNTSPLQIESEIAALVEPASLLDVPAAIVVGPHSPPPGASVLRI
jgi:hypothetical protein